MFVFQAIVNKTVPPGGKKDDRMLTCTKCGRVNSSDARFCDWCGTKVCIVAGPFTM